MIINYSFLLFTTPTSRAYKSF